MKLIDIQKWLTIFPQKLNILCCFTSKFPIDWIEAFNRNESSMVVLFYFFNILKKDKGLFLIHPDKKESLVLEKKL